MRFMQTIFSVAILALARLVVPQQALAEQADLRITIPVKALLYYPVFAAKDLGYFSEEGINMDIVVTQGDGPDVDALIAGSVQFAATTPNRLLTAYEQGKSLLGVMTISKRIAINCFMNKEKADALGVTESTPIAEKFQKLKGLTIGGTRPGAFTNLLAADYIKRGGMVPQQDARVIGVGAGPAMLAALENKQIDVGCIASPTPEIAVSRGKSIMFMNNTLGWDKEFEEFLFAVLYVRPDYAKANPETVRKVIRALQKANAYIINTPFDQQLTLLQKEYGELDPAILRDALTNTQSAIEPSGKISQRSVEAAEKLFISVGVLSKPIPWDAVTDNSFLAKP
ncbi:ABC transporter substrate-binding protein [Bradyrhizobium canariense]|uniref:ABC-type nitrate/sulfonate/bicarbonate transport system, substrate-binding protein n=1 Tax=Bradyrhizobium canariense TaxID=255045 RepID=A0A1H2BIX1_9BRAD|nr:ABC transporter substrate-binding protein [Bradyrhizobium canariense]SDT58128.1 ABC-type nitrate/sulfonate/bicarbonate transport system, substrate-binding protein [Bradyrhizobium canariense]